MRPKSTSERTLRKQEADIQRALDDLHHGRNFGHLPEPEQLQLVDSLEKRLAEVRESLGKSTGR